MKIWKFWNLRISNFFPKISITKIFLQSFYLFNLRFFIECVKKCVILKFWEKYANGQENKQFLSWSKFFSKRLTKKKQWSKSKPGRFFSSDRHFHRFSRAFRDTLTTVPYKIFALFSTNQHIETKFHWISKTLNFIEFPVFFSLLKQCS